MPPLIELKGVSRVYTSLGEELYALRDVSLSFQKGEYVGIMGASGSGKSTLMNIIGGLDRPTAGTYLLEGAAVNTLGDKQLSKIRNRTIGFVFQSFNLLPRYTALQNVELPLVYAGLPMAERRERALKSLTRVGLADRMSHRPNQLSGGQQQRVAIARAIVTNPAILLADEPTGALDTETTGQILDLLQTLHGEGMTLILVTHEPDVAAHAKRVIVMRDGRVIEDRRQSGKRRPMDNAAAPFPVQEDGDHVSTR